MKALLVIDYINEIVSTDGKLSGKGYVDFMEKNNTFEKVNESIEAFRTKDLPVIFINLGFHEGYVNQPKGSPVFGKANEFEILVENTWSTSVCENIDKKNDDLIIVKPRVSAFHDTGLDDVLHEKGVTEVCIAAVATDLAGESTARSAHDLDFGVTLLADACAAANQDDHQKTLDFVAKIGSVVNVSELVL